MLRFRISGLPSARFSHLYGMSDVELATNGVLRYTADENPGFPDRIELRDLEVGEQALLLNYVHLDAATPYRASHAIFVREGAMEPFDRICAVPRALRIRTLSLRGFDAGGLMHDADLVDGTELESALERLFLRPDIAYVHAHYAKRGCYAARIDRWMVLL